MGQAWCDPRDASGSPRISRKVLTVLRTPVHRNKLTITSGNSSSTRWLCIFCMCASYKDNRFSNGCPLPSSRKTSWVVRGRDRKRWHRRQMRPWNVMYFKRVDWGTGSSAWATLVEWISKKLVQLWSKRENDTVWGKDNPWRIERVRISNCVDLYLDRVVRRIEVKVPSWLRKKEFPSVLEIFFYSV